MRRQILWESSRGKVGLTSESCHVVSFFCKFRSSATFSKGVINKKFSTNLDGFPKWSSSILTETKRFVYSHWFFYFWNRNRFDLHIFFITFLVELLSSRYFFFLLAHENTRFTHEIAVQAGNFIFDLFPRKKMVIFFSQFPWRFSPLGFLMVIITQILYEVQ